MRPYAGIREWGLSPLRRPKRTAARGRPKCSLPARRRPSLVREFHRLRTSCYDGRRFWEIGGYREALGFYGEEKEFCLRLLDSGYVSVYLPDSLIAHVPDPSGRSQQRYLRFVSRNDCFNTLYNDPMTRLLWMLPARFALYFRMRRGWKIRDPWGWDVAPAGVGCRTSRCRLRTAVRCRGGRWPTWQTLRRGDTPYAGTISRVGGTARWLSARSS